MPVLNQLIDSVVSLQKHDSLAMPLSDLWSELGDEDESSDQSQGHDEPGAQAKAEARRKQTEKARIQRRINQYKKPLEEIRNQKMSDQQQSWASGIQERMFTPRFFQTPFARDHFGEADWKNIARERGRAAKSLMVQLVHMIFRMLSPSSSAKKGGKIHVALDGIILDDTSCRIKGRGDSMPAIRTVMNTVHTLHLSFQDGNCQSVHIPTPYVCLPSQRTEDLHSGYCAYALLSSKGVGGVFKAVEQFCNHKEALQTLLSSCRWTCQAMIGDALKTNDAVFKREREIVARHNQSSNGRLAIRLKCQLHQLCLVRRPIVMSTNRFWTTLVRLGHLFEQWSFRKQLALALVQILRDSGGFQRSLA